ncbi:MAG TPA: HEAT repeat domain-containing protein [Candidatus Dormibacteraeota bacterium]|nr:HEAT repeat domain-containing protein [Candidatus Dormibacteraeota bacterium]
MKADPKTSAGRAFVRSLNILLKFARLYGYEHVRTIEQLQIAWEELRNAIPLGTDAGLLLGATNSQLLLDGVPLEGSPAEKQFAQLLSAAGLASVQFFASVTEEEIGRFVRAFPTGKAKPAQLALQLKAALVGAKGIHINEIYFVATDARLKDASIAAQIAAASLGGDQDEFRQWLNDPQKLLELIAAAQGSKSGGGSGPGPGGPGELLPAAVAPGARNSGGNDGFGYGREIAGSGTNSPIAAGLTAGKGNGRGGHGEPSEEEIYGILSALTSFGHVGTGQGGVAAAGAFQEQVSQLPGHAQDMLKQALASMAAQAPNAKPDESVIVQLAEHLAIRFALERFERGEVKVNSVRQMLDRMNQEIENLRKILGAHEDKMSEAGMLVQSHRDILDREFWAAVPESGKRAVLLSEEAWCIPPRNVQSYVGELIKQGNIAEAISILQNYAACAESEESDARKKTAVGLSEMAELYSKADPKLLSVALRHLGLRLSVEPESELQGLVGAAFVRLSQEAATSRCFPAMEQALDLIAGVESHRPGIARSMRSKMGIEERVPEFVEEALKARHVAAGLTNVLKLLPQTAMEQLAVRFNRCSLRDDSEHIANLAGDLGENGVEYLRSAVRGGPIAEAVELAGLLSRLDPESVMEYLPGRMKDFPRSSQDRIVRQISASGATGRCQILLKMLDHVDPLVTPLVIDEIGVTSDREALGKLLTLADGDLPPGGGPYLRVKAIEALGRIQAPESVITLKRIAESKKVFGWLHPQELRIAALQALENLDPDWVRDYLPGSGIDQEDLKLAPLDTPVTSKFVRQRRHTRVRMRKTVRAVCTNLKEACSMEIKTASMTGGVATLSRHLSPGTQVQLRLQVGMRNLQATALMRDSRAQDMAFEIVDMNLDERGKYRRMLAGHLSNNSNTQGPAEGALVLMPAGIAALK